MDFAGLERPLKQVEEGEFFPSGTHSYRRDEFCSTRGAAGTANLPKTVLQSGLARDRHVS